MQFGAKPLFENVSVKFGGGNRYGLIGANGCGKSTFMKILGGDLEPSGGQVMLEPNVRLGKLRQDQFAYENFNVLDTVNMGHEERWKVKAERDRIYALPEMSEDDGMAVAELETDFAEMDGYTAESRAGELLMGLGIPVAQHFGPMSEVAPGWKLRVLLAQALFSDPEVLLLDEPTNHLDFTSIMWLEGLLRDFKGSVLFITHDRSFLDNVATRIIELDRGRLLSYPGNFSAYQVRKSEQLEIEEVEAAKFDKFLAQEEVWIRKGVKARRVRDEGRVRRLEALRLARAARREQQGQVKLEVGAGERSGKIVADLENVSKSYGEKLIVNDFSATILRGDKVGLIGANGAGKTTLLKMILGEEEADAGKVRLGTKLQVAYFDQMRAQLNEEASLMETIAPGSDWVEINGQRKHVMTYLNDFLFAPERARSPVKSLSGGERNRLLLARLFAKPANCLVLDEPTNDLDIDTLELLEELLEDYAGTVFLVSHDRTFLDNVVTQVIVAEGQGLWREYVGGYSDWERVKAQAPAPAKSGAKAAPAPSTVQGTIAKKPKLSYKEQRELEELPQLIASLEDEQSAITQQLNSPDFYKTNPADAKRINARFAQIEEQLLEALEKWEQIEARSKG
ncbi:MAG: ATP-binding cassette domain-containing protein [Telluria sp.]|nr:ATP-binding cassette domain-containing protein [Telluria sp.]